MIVLFCLIQFLDVWTTLAILKKGGRELNPVVKKLIDKFGAKEALIGSKVLLVGAFVLLQPPDWLWWAVSGITGLVVLNNLNVLGKM